MVCACVDAGRKMPANNVCLAHLFSGTMNFGGSSEGNAQRKLRAVNKFRIDRMVRLKTEPSKSQRMAAEEKFFGPSERRLERFRREKKNNRN